MRFLIIDDSAVMRKMISRALRQGGLELSAIHEAGDGQQGLEQLAAQSVDAVLCDWNMPVMDGMEFLEQARATSQVPIVMLTTEADERKQAAARVAGANGYLTKPFTPEKLAAVLTQALDSAA